MKGVKQTSAPDADYDVCRAPLHNGGSATLSFHSVEIGNVAQKSRDGNRPCLLFVESGDSY